MGDGFGGVVQLEDIGVAVEMVAVMTDDITEREHVEYEGERTKH